MICRSFSISVALYSAELDDRLFNICSNHSEFTPANEKLSFKFTLLSSNPSINWRDLSSITKIDRMKKEIKIKNGNRES